MSEGVFRRAGMSLEERIDSAWQSYLGAMEIVLDVAFNEFGDEEGGLAQQFNTRRHDAIVAHSGVAAEARRLDAARSPTACSGEQE